jgi:DNA-directed RNA polymerase subunit K/omega
MEQRPASDNSKFRIILLTAARSRQLQAGAKPLILTAAGKSTRIAREEFAAGVVPWEIPNPNP